MAVSPSPPTVGWASVDHPYFAALGALAGEYADLVAKQPWPPVLPSVRGLAFELLIKEPDALLRLAAASRCLLQGWPGR